MVRAARSLAGAPVPDALGHSEDEAAEKQSRGESPRRAGQQVQGRKSWHPLRARGRYSLLQNLDAEVSRGGVALLEGHLGLVPRLFQPYPDEDVLDDSEPQYPVGVACLGRRQATARGGAQRSQAGGLLSPAGLK